MKENILLIGIKFMKNRWLWSKVGCFYFFDNLL